MRRANRRRRRWPSWLLRLLALCVVLSVIVVASLRWIAPPTSAFMLRHATRDATVHYQWVPWTSLSPQLALAVVASEDQRFPDHRGFDFGAIRKAVEDHIDGGRLRGGSTITQQVAKNLFLWPGRSLLRKSLEAYLTVLIEALLPKRRVLEIYLNVAQFGPETFGAHAASRRYFDTAPDALTLRQAALMASVLPNPKVMRLDEPSRQMRQRALWIERQMRQLGGASYLSKIR